MIIYILKDEAMNSIDHRCKYANIVKSRPHRLAWSGRLLLRQKTPVQIRLGLCLYGSPPKADPPPAENPVEAINLELSKADE